MGLMNPFERADNLKPKKKGANQRAEWNIISYGGQRCIYIVGYSESEDKPSQNMIFEPHHIEEFESIIKAWRQEQ